MKPATAAEHLLSAARAAESRDLPGLAYTLRDAASQIAEGEPAEQAELLAALLSPSHD